MSARSDRTKLAVRQRRVKALLRLAGVSKRQCGVYMRFVEQKCPRCGVRLDRVE